MPWCEVIRVQMSSSRSDQICLDYLAELKQKVSMNKDLEIRLYKDADMVPQHMVWLEWKAKEQPVIKSTLSKKLIYELKQFGLVDYSSWMSLKP